MRVASRKLSTSSTDLVRGRLSIARVYCPRVVPDGPDQLPTRDVLVTGAAMLPSADWKDVSAQGARGMG
jgi:hypothetical protein